MDACSIGRGEPQEAPDQRRCDSRVLAVGARRIRGTCDENQHTVQVASLGRALRDGHSRRASLSPADQTLEVISDCSPGASAQIRCRNCVSQERRGRVFVRSSCAQIQCRGHILRSYSVCSESERLISSATARWIEENRAHPRDTRSPQVDV